MKQTLLFDLDDTLIYCNKYFNLTLEQFADTMLDWFSSDSPSRAAILDKHTEIDIAGVKVLGFQSEHFPQSFLDTYRYFSELYGRDQDSAEQKLLWDLGISVYEHEVEPYPHMEETLSFLRDSGHDLHLYTGGDPVIQRRKIERLQLERYFEDRIYVRMHKNTDALKEILTEGSFEQGRTWMIGNSIRTDVVPALECGLNAIYMKRDQEWMFNMIPIDAAPQGAFLTLTDLSEVPPAIERYLVSEKEPGV
ncbi:HAD family hydrolase [Cohnella thailandensis]|uniref:HAD family hydrolase n=1 Tax=Cohnella thailandensis TaxID=557557 RepID=A0A841T551_9BACL|nr:HAD family hydrolase [Cohnella thailandensis]MBB6636987.1 HAD family hydrolase [Cohnella thailandensis]MBP1973130.1 putative hydrolase of the HAD superfamily [Cohnella thailandensis]